MICSKMLHTPVTLLSGISIYMIASMPVDVAKMGTTSQTGEARAGVLEDLYLGLLHPVMATHLDQLWIFPRWSSPDLISINIILTHPPSET